VQQGKQSERSAIDREESQDSLKLVGNLWVCTYALDYDNLQGTMAVAPLPSSYLCKFPFGANSDAKSQNQWNTDEHHSQFNQVDTA
jgi:hypothetical protein